jgi:hypothetical protein
VDALSGTGQGPTPASPPRSWGWVLAVVLLTLLWPLLQLLVFALRFGRLPPGGAAEALVFLPLGLVSAVVLVLLLRRSRSLRQAGWTLVGYAVAAPLALVGSLTGGLVLPGAVGALVGGVIPLAVGAVLGYLAGARA